MRRFVPAVLLVAACSGGEDRAPVRHEQPTVKPFTMTITPAATPVAGTPIALTLELRDPGGKRVTGLEVMHEKLLHLIVVSADLSFFTHEHPEHHADGLLTHSLTLPSPGEYTAFADFTPSGGKPTVVSAPITIGGPAPAAVGLVPVALPATAHDGGFSVELRADRPLVGSGEAMLAFTVRDANGPVTDLQNYLGAKGHCVIISADRTRYLHSHPMGGDGSTVQFHTTFPAAGTYKIWIELRPRGEPLRVSFTVDVPPGDAAKPMSMTEDEDHH